MSVKLITGLKGDGKTTLMTYFAYVAHQHHQKVFANYELHFLSEKLNLADAYNSQQFANCIICIDEAAMYIDSRNFSKIENKLFGYLFLQSRKRGVNIVMAAHQGSMIDLRVRDNLDYVYRVTGLAQFEKGYRRATVEEIEQHKVVRIHVLKYNIREKKLNAYLFDPMKYFDLYNTHEFIDILHKGVTIV